MRVWPRPPYRGAVSARFASSCWPCLLVVGCSAPSRAAPQGFTVGSTDHALNFRRPRPVLSPLHSRRAADPGTARGDASRRLRQCRAGRKGLRLGPIGRQREVRRRLPRRRGPRLEHERRLLRATRPRAPRRRRIHHRCRQRRRRQRRHRRQPRLRHRHQQRRHDVVRIGLQHRNIRGDRPGLGDPARRLRRAASNVGHAHPRHRRPADPVRRRSPASASPASTGPPCRISTPSGAVSTTARRRRRRPTAR